LGPAPAEVALFSQRGKWPGGAERDKLKRHRPKFARRDTRNRPHGGFRPLRHRFWRSVVSAGMPPPWEDPRPPGERGTSPVKEALHGPFRGVLAANELLRKGREPQTFRKHRRGHTAPSRNASFPGCRVRLSRAPPPRRPQLQSPLDSTSGADPCFIAQRDTIAPWHRPPKLQVGSPWQLQRSPSKD